MLKKIFAAFVFSLLATQALAANLIYSKDGKAIKGYDPVAYFTEGAPVIGRDQFTYVWKGANWFFSSEENMERFIADPESYAPQYGGYCAYGVAKGATAKINPDAWSIIDGKLYLNYNQSIQARWDKDRDGYIRAANKNWPGLSAQ